MQQLLKILLLEDEPQDVEIQIRFLKEKGLQFNYKVVEDKPAYLDALQHFKPDVILTNHTLPLFNSEEALELMQQQFPDTVFILVTGTVSEEFAAAIIKKGADDYILKDRLSRLPEAIKSALKHREAEKQKNNVFQLLTENEEQYRISLDRITDAFVALNSNWCYTYMNKKAGEIFQRNPVDMIGKHIWTEFPEGIDQTFYKAYYQAMEQQQYIHVEAYYPPYDKWFENHIYPSVDGLSIFFRDITEQKKYTREFKLREKYFQVLLENNTAIIALTDDDLNSIYQSPSSIRITGWTTDDMKVKGGISYFHPDDIVKVKKTVAEATKKPGIPQHYLVRFLHKNGHYIWLEGTITKLQDESIVKGIVFNSHDVTEKVELEQLLLKANRLARIGNWNVDLIKQNVYWNDITREIHEVDKSFVPDLPSGLNYYKEGPSRELITQKVKEAIELGEPWDEELEIVTAKNNARWIRTIGKTEFVDGKCVKIYGSFQDIDREKKAEVKLKESINRYRRLFDTSPVAITEEDHTVFYEKIESLRASGISKNYAIYFDNHSDELYEMLGRVHILGVNQGLLDLTGAKNLEDFVANRSKFFVSMTEMTVFKLMDLIRDGGGYFEEVTKIKSLSGEIKEVIVRLKYPAAPPYNSVAITMHDITKQKEAEHKIRESEEMQKIILQSLLDYVIILNADGEIQYVNHVSSGVTEAEVVGSSFLLWLHEDDQLEVKKAIRNTLSSGVFSQIQIRAIGPERKMTWFNTKIFCMPNLSSQQVLLVATDITEQKNHTNELELREQRFRILIENNPAIISLTDDSLNLIYRSPSSESITGFSDKDIKTIADINRVHPDDINAMKTTVDKAMKNPGIAHPYLSRYQHKNGHYIWLEGTVTKLQDDSIEKGIVFNSHDVTEKVELEQLLLKANRLARIGNWNVDLIKQTVYWNDITREIHEADNSFVPDLATGLNFYKEGPGRELITQKVKEAIELGKPWDEELEIVTVKNNVRWIRTIGETEFVDGKCVKIYGSFQDIHRRKKAEEDLLFVNKEKATALNRINDAVLSFDNEWRYTYMNDAALALNPLSREETIGKNVLEVNPELEATTTWALYQEAMRTKLITEVENFYEPYGLWINAKIYPSADGLTFFYKNVSERKRAEEELKKSNLLLSEAQRIAKIGSWTYYMDGNLKWSDNMHQLYGLPSKITETTPEFFYELVHPDDREIMQNWMQVCLAGDTPGEYEFRSILPDSSMHYYIGSGELKYDTENSPVYMSGIVQDITERKKADEEIKNTNKQLRQLTAHLQTIREEERKRIGREIHDELGQQLTAIKMDAVWINKKTTDENNPIKSKLKNIITLLDGSNQSVRKILSELRSVNLENQALTETMEWQGRQFTETIGIPVKFIYTETSLTLSERTATSIFRVYQESLTNIMKYASAKKVSVSLIQQGEYIILTVEDDGVGFDMAAVQKKKTFGLLGMKERVLSLNGKFELISAKAKGTKIVVSLPYKNT